MAQNDTAYFGEQRTPNEMGPGEQCYTYPPTDADGRPWSVENGSIRFGVPIFREPTATATWKIIRLPEHGALHAGFWLIPPEKIEEFDQSVTAERLRLFDAARLREFAASHGDTAAGATDLDG